MLICLHVVPSVVKRGQLCAQMSTCSSSNGQEGETAHMSTCDKTCKTPSVSVAMKTI